MEVKLWQVSKKDKRDWIGMMWWGGVKSFLPLWDAAISSWTVPGALGDYRHCEHHSSSREKTNHFLVFFSISGVPVVLRWLPYCIGG